MTNPTTKEEAIEKLKEEAAVAANEVFHPLFAESIGKLLNFFIDKAYAKGVTDSIGALKERPTGSMHAEIYNQAVKDANENIGRLIK